MLPIALALVLLWVSLSVGEECKVESREVVRAVYGSGYVRSERQIMLRSGVSGYVKRIFVEEGDRVHRGQLLALIDSAGLEDRIASLKARIDTLRKKLGDNSPFMRSLKHKVAIAEENLARAERVYRRREVLFKKGVIPREEFEEAKRLYEIAREELGLAQSSLEDAVEELKGKLRSLEAESRSLEKELEKYRIRSPMDGVVLKKLAEEGDYLNQLGGKNGVLVIGSLRKEVVLEVDEEFLPLIERGQEVFIVSDAFREKVFRGKVSSFSMQSDALRRIVEVRVEVSLPDKIPVDSVVEGNVIVERLKTTVVPLRFVKDGRITLLVRGKKESVRVRRIFGNYAEVIGAPAGTPCVAGE